jgi:hypothetical protein
LGLSYKSAFVLLHKLCDGADASDVKAGLQHLQDGFNLHHGRFDFDTSLLNHGSLPRSRKWAGARLVAFAP